MSRTKKHPYTKSKAFDHTCRNHGSCSWCVHNRLIRTMRELERTNFLNDVKVPDKPEAERHYERNSYSMYDDHDYFDYTTYKGFIG